MTEIWAKNVCPYMGTCTIFNYILALEMELTVLEVQHQVVQTVQTAKLLTWEQQVKKVIAHGVSTYLGFLWR